MSTVAIHTSGSVITEAIETETMNTAGVFLPGQVVAHPTCLCLGEGGNLPFVDVRVKIDIRVAVHAVQIKMNGRLQVGFVAVQTGVILRNKG